VSESIEATLTAPDQYRQAEEAAQLVLARSPLHPRAAIVLGSGLGSFADELHASVSIPYAGIPHFPLSTAVGHAGRLAVGTTSGIPVAVMQGRFHLYEGYSARQVAFPVRVLARMGVKALVLTNAAGSINPAYGRGALVAIRDHINLQGQNPLLGPNDERFGPRFPDMADCYHPQFRAFMLAEAERLGAGAHEGVYAAVLGPSYETPAEIRCLRTMGADLVGMSTVAEVIAARHMGLDVLAISCVTNMAAGLSVEKISHDEVLETGERVRGKLLSLLRSVLPRIDRYLDSRLG
jgi:purine-nucleoside phosphorylase